MLAETEKIEPNFINAYKSYYKTWLKCNSFTRWDMIKLIFLGDSRWNVFIIILGFTIDSVAKNFTSILIGFLIESIYERNVL